MGTKEGTDVGEESRNPVGVSMTKSLVLLFFASLPKASSIPGDRKVAQATFGPVHVLGERVRLTQFESEMTAVSLCRLK